MLTLNDLAINNTQDTDWFKFRVASAGRLTLTATLPGRQYTVGDDGGAAPAPVDSLRYGNLALQVVAANGAVLATVNATGLGEAETIADLQLPMVVIISSE